MKYLFSFLFAGMSLISFAQNNFGPMRGMTDFTPEQNAVLQTKKMTLALDLNSTQQKQILDLNKKRAVERKKKMDSRKAMMSSDGKPSSEERFNMMNEMLDYQLVHQNQMKSILKSDQYSKWKETQKGQMMNMHKKGKMNYNRGNCQGTNRSNNRGKSHGKSKGSGSGYGNGNGYNK